MDIVKRICEKYRIEYNLTFDRLLLPVHLTFSPAVPQELQDRILEGLCRTGVYQEDTGIPLMLTSCPDDTYELSRAGETQYRFRNSVPSIPFPDYDISEAISWVIYIIASRKDWLNDCKGQYISCRCFSARQQSAAVRISKCVDAQYGTSVPEELVSRFYSKFRNYLSEVVDSAPRFSTRPITPEAFQALKGKPQEITLKSLAAALFGNEPFTQELDWYLSKVRSGNFYKESLAEAQRILASIAYRLPMSAVGYFFTAVGDYVDTIERVSLDSVTSLLSKRVTFSLTAENIRSSFLEVDQVYHHYFETTLQREFFRDALDLAMPSVMKETHAVKMNIYRLRNSLHRFCFLEQEHFFRNDSADSPMSWKQLSELTDSEIFCPDVSWDSEALHDLQSEILAVSTPHTWICSERLKNLADMHMITDAYNTKSAPVMDERLVWALWADAN